MLKTKHPKFAQKLANIDSAQKQNNSIYLCLSISETFSDKKEKNLVEVKFYLIQQHLLQHT